MFKLAYDKNFLTEQYEYFLKNLFFEWCFANNTYENFSSCHDFWHWPHTRRPTQSPNQGEKGGNFITPDTEKIVEEKLCYFRGVYF